MDMNWKEEFLNPDFVAYADKDTKKLCSACKEAIKTGKYVLCSCGTAFCNLDCYDKYEKEMWEKNGIFNMFSEEALSKQIDYEDLKEVFNIENKTSFKNAFTNCKLFGKISKKGEENKEEENDIVLKSLAGCPALEWLNPKDFKYLQITEE